MRRTIRHGIYDVGRIVEAALYTLLELSQPLGREAVLGVQRFTGSVYLRTVSRSFGLAGTRRVGDFEPVAPLRGCGSRRGLGGLHAPLSIRGLSMDSTGCGASARKDAGEVHGGAGCNGVLPRLSGPPSGD